MIAVTDRILASRGLSRLVITYPNRLIPSYENNLSFSKPQIIKRKIYLANLEYQKNRIHRIKLILRASLNFRKQQNQS